MTIYQVDAFAERPFEGNPAGVCILPGLADGTWMQNVAMEMNLSETAFLYPAEGGYHLQWFTPVSEVSLCGHATLASAHVLWETGMLGAGDSAVFFTQSGRLTAELADGIITLDFPARECQPSGDSPALEQALGAPVRRLSNIGPRYLAELADEAAVRALQPDLAAVMKAGAGSVIVTARASTPGYDFVSRFFAPAVGVAEDPVTGSSHCSLGPYWRDRLGKTVFSAYQASRRGGKLIIEVRGDHVRIGGRAVTVFSADMRA